MIWGIYKVIGDPVYRFFRDILWAKIDAFGGLYQCALDAVRGLRDVRSICLRRAVAEESFVVTRRNDR